MKIVTAALLEKDGKILIAQRKQGDVLEFKWEFPGGKLEPEETPEQCLTRELLEELGVQVEVKDFFCSSIYRYKHIAIELLAYHTTHLAGQFQLHVHEKIAWVTPTQMHAYDFSQADIPIIQKLIER